MKIPILSEQGVLATVRLRTFSNVDRENMARFTGHIQANQG